MCYIPHPETAPENLTKVWNNMRTRFYSPLMLVPVLLLLAAQAPASDFVPHDVTLNTGTGELFGTLLGPEAGSEQVPVVLIISGSGPTDRNGNSALFPANNNSLKQIAEGLANFGVASLRYDKRGVAASAGAAVSEWQLSFDQGIDDARRWCDLLAEDTRFSSVIVAGHSEGSLVGMNAAWQSGAQGFASLAGTARPICDVLRTQLRGQLPIQSRVEAEKVLSALENGRLVEEPPIELSILFRPSVQPYLISWQQHDPVKDIARLQVPILILHGTTDVQVAVQDAELLAATRPDAKLVILQGYNHIFKEIQGQDPMIHQLSLADSTLVVSSVAVAALAQLAQDAEKAALSEKELREAVHLFNLGLSPLPDADGINKYLSASNGKPVAANVGYWARYFASRDDILYCFGPNDGGYVAQGALVLDGRQDCVSLLYRCSELARSGSLAESVDWALKTRFAGAPLAAFTGSSGSVDYENPAHLDYSLDMIRSGNWGADMTASMTGAVVDEKGTSRYPAGSFSYVAGDALVPAELQEGDVVWFVFDAEHEKGAKMRHDYGLAIGHIGLVVMDDGVPNLIHAASSDLSGYYKGGTVVKVPLSVYLERVEKFSGVMMTRFMAE
jgi:uncharacterized protein